MSKRVCMVWSASAFLSVIGVATLWVWATFSVALGGIQLANERPVPSLTNSVSTSSDINTTWRHTKDGWQDSATWSTNSFVPEKSIERLHPVIWATIICLFVVSAVIWASSEWEIARLFGESDE